jgi:hypothetical protein
MIHRTWSCSAHAKDIWTTERWEIEEKLAEVDWLVTCSQAAHGHTPGHNVYVLQSEGQQMVLLGDLIHVASVQLESPEVTIGFDSDEPQARAARTRLFKSLAQSGSLVAVAHFPFPGVGRLRAMGKGFVWEPLNYSSQVK